MMCNKENSVIKISFACSVQASTVYFKTKELAEAAIKIIGKDIENMFD